MNEPGTPVEMTKGYRGEKGTLLERLESEYELYVIKLENGIHIVAGPEAFVLLNR